MEGPDRTRCRILERRAAFLSASLAALSGCPSPPPQQEPPATQAVAAPPDAQPSTDVVDAAVAAEAIPPPQDAGSEAAAPRVTLSVCLSIIRPPPVSFGPGNAMPSSSSASTLDTVARVMVEHPDLVVEVQGHTDAIEANAQPLSERRALSVMQALIDRGVPAERLCARGYAQARPLVPNRTVDERAKNRRVEFRVMQGDEACLP